MIIPMEDLNELKSKLRDLDVEVSLRSSKTDTEYLNKLKDNILSLFDTFGVVLVEHSISITTSPGKKLRHIKIFCQSIE